MTEVVRRPGSAARDGVRIRVRAAEEARANDTATATADAAVRERGAATESRHQAVLPAPPPRYDPRRHQAPPERHTEPRLQHRVALVTGAAQGLGAAIAEEFALGGIRVVAADVQADRARQLAQLLDPIGDDVAWCPLDVTDRRSVDAAMDVTLARFGRLDVLVNNAGIDLTLPFDEIEPEAFDRILDVNLRGPIDMCRAALPALRASGRGMIVNIVSTAAKRAWPNASAYHASKWGLLGFSHALHTEARGYGVRVTAVICGGMRTPFILERFPDTPLGNLQEPRSVATTIRSIVDADHDSVIPELTILPLGETSWP
jgi:NAD(P)-dependent dehydrogenase (short-subunit alcohol dehydrogenase family)